MRWVTWRAMSARPYPLARRCEEEKLIKPGALPPDRRALFQCLNSIEGCKEPLKAAAAAALKGVQTLKRKVPCYIVSDACGKGRAVQVDPMQPMLKAPGSKRLKLEHHNLLSNFAFKMNLRRYIKGPPRCPASPRRACTSAAGAYTRSLFSSTSISDTQKHPAHHKYPLTPP